MSTVFPSGVDADAPPTYTFDVPGHGPVLVWFGRLRPGDFVPDGFAPADRPWTVGYRVQLHTEGEIYEGADFTVPFEHIRITAPLSEGVALALLDAIGFQLGHPWLVTFAEQDRAYDGRRG